MSKRIKIFLLLNFAPLLAMADNSVMIKTPLNSDIKDIPGFLEFILSDLIGTFLVPISILAIIWVGFQFVKAQGNPEALKKARENAKWVAVGIFMVLIFIALYHSFYQLYVKTNTN